jgi:hypothetical protein
MHLQSVIPYYFTFYTELHEKLLAVLEIKNKQK